jgi:hypothetical protein
MVSGLRNVPAASDGFRHASKPFVLNAAPSDCVDTPHDGTVLEAIAPGADNQAKSLDPDRIFSSLTLNWQRPHVQIRN